MEYQLYKLKFPNGVHFGNGSLDSSEYTFCADTLFSALCQTAAKIGDDKLKELVACVERGGLAISDAFPCMGKELFLPKPVMYVGGREDRGDSIIKKTYKKMKYIPVSHFDEYLRGKFPIEAAEQIKGLGSYQMKTSAAVRGLEDAMPYRVRIFRFSEGNGLYVICVYRECEARDLFEELMEDLSLEGIGGKRSSGLGRFVCMPMKMNPLLKQRLGQDSRKYMTLSISIPGDEEMDEALEGASYLIQKRSGFVASAKYAPEWMRKKDAYLFGAGSCFLRTYQGKILDVSSGGAHPVYRYGKPIFLGVDE